MKIQSLGNGAVTDISLVIDESMCCLHLGSSDSWRLYDTTIRYCFVIELQRKIACFQCMNEMFCLFNLVKQPQI